MNTLAIITSISIIAFFIAATAKELKHLSILKRTDTALHKKGFHRK